MRLTLLLLVSCKLLGQYDVLVYRATPAGISAAVAVSREGLSVAIVEPALKPGGMMTNGLSASDVCLSRTIGGF
ncbi:MAG: FAD-dependent oxidoreductase, partial [Deltaproteobacteria bacterium]|nr:FAD-dependent oxidoreductase [Deltaproteobacteria bacterium]